MKKLPFHAVAEPQSWAVLTEAPAYLVVTGENWQRYYRAQPGGADFARNLYLVVSSGPKPNAGYRVSITGVRQTGRAVEVAVRLREPEPGRAYAQVMVRPVAVVWVETVSLLERGLITFRFVGERGGGDLARTEMTV